MALMWMAALGAAPSTRPATRPMNIDQLAEVPRYTLATKGKHPKESFEMLAKAAELSIEINEQYSKNKKGRTFWENEYREVDFDLNDACLWESLTLLARQARLTWEFKSPDRIVLGLREPKNVEGDVVLAPLSEVGPMEEDSIYYVGGIECNAWLWKDELSIDIKPDPTIMICGVGWPVFEEVLNERGEKIFGKWRDGKEVYVFDPMHQGLKRVKGYIPATVVVKSKRMEIPLEVGATVEEGGWEFEIVDFQKVRFPMKIGVFFGMEWKGEGRHADLTDIGSFLQMRDEYGMMADMTYGPDRHVRPTVSGGREADGVV